MSTNNEGTPTPLTDAAAFSIGFSITPTAVPIYFARQLERDLTATKQRLEAAEKDSARLDWLEKHAYDFEFRFPINGGSLRKNFATGGVIRAVITAAMLAHPSADKAESNEEKNL